MSTEKDDTRIGGLYVPPQKVKILDYDPNSAQYQKQTWELLKKQLNGLINKLSRTNVKSIIPELLALNLIRGRGVFVRSIMKAQSVSGIFTDVYAGAVAVINTKFPMIGELLINRLIYQFRRGYARNDKAACLSATKFIAHLMNQKIVHEVISLQILTLLLERPTDDSVEVAVGFTKEAGQFLLQISPRATNAVFERFRTILHEGQIDKRTQYMVEVLFQVYRDGFKDFPAVRDELDLVEEEDQITHNIGLDDEVETMDVLNVFAFDEDFVANERKYEMIKKEILGGSSDEEEDSDEGSDEDSDEDSVPAEHADIKQQMKIRDETNTNLINLRRAIYLTIMSSVNFEETAHKLSKIQIDESNLIELCNMVVECCSQERTYVNFYGLLGERFCRMSPKWMTLFTLCFQETYKTIHRFETNRLRNIAKFFGHLISSDAIGWECFEIVKLTEEDTTSSSRIFLKILFQEILASMGIKTMKQRFADDEMRVGNEMRNVFAGLFPLDHPKNTRFAINYFTSIGLGFLTEGMREYLKNAPKRIMEQSDSSEDESSSSESSSSSDESSSESSEDERPVRKRSRSRSASRDRYGRRGRSYSRDRSRSSSRDSRKRRR